MNDEFKKNIDRLVKVFHVFNRPNYCVVNAHGGCNFVVDPSKPHLGGNLEGGDSGAFYPKTLWPWLISRFSVKTMVDIGCAEGHCVEWFKKNKITAYGVEGLKRNVEVCKSKYLDCIEHDYHSGPLVHQSVDLAWCSDVVEHINEEYIPNILETFKCCRVLAICHGLEVHEKCGWHHVTNKSEEWWIEKIESSINFKYNKGISDETRKLCGGGWWEVSGKIFERI